MTENLWQATASPSPDTEPLDQSRHTDVVAVGAGYTGLSTALHLAELGVDVTVLEAEEIGYGGSGRNMGQVNAGFLVLPHEVVRLMGNEVGARMNAVFTNSADLVFNLINRHAIECDAVRKGNLFLAHDNRTRTLIELFRDQHLELGAQIEWLDTDDTRSYVGSPVYTNAALDHRSGTVQPLSYARGLARAAIKEGAAIYTQSRVTSLAKQHDGWEAKTDSGVSIIAAKVVLATDSYSDSLWPGLARTLIPITAQQIATEPLSENVARTILDGGQATADRMRFVHYFRKDGSGRLIMVSGGPSPPKASLFKQFFPQLDNVRIDYEWNGTVALSRDHLPFLCRLASGVTGVVGFSGRGLSAGTMIGKLLAEHLSDKVPEQDLAVPVRALDPQTFRSVKTGAMSLLLSSAKLVDAVLMRTRGL